MDRQIQNQYAPDYVSPPGETLLETLEAIGMTQVQLAERTGKSPKTINEIVKGIAPITPETALQFERVLGVPARFWNNRERQYREFLAHHEERKRLENSVEWLEQVPLKAMFNCGWIQGFEDPVDQLREVLRFFGVASPVEWNQVWMRPQAAFRQSPAFQADPVAVAAWLRKGELEAQQLECEPFDKQCFRVALEQIRALTTRDPNEFQPEIVRLCAQAGIAVVFVPALPKTRASGATRWLTPEKAMIQLSLRHKSDDQLWFTFFHEAGHIWLHGKREAFVDVEDGDSGEKEEQANQFAADLLVPRTRWRRFVRAAHHYSKGEIQTFAAELGIAPGIVVGRLQKEEVLPHTHCNNLKHRLDWQWVDGMAVMVQQ